MKWSGVGRLLVAVVAATALAGCHSSLLTAVTPPTVDLSSTFTGQLTASGTSYQTFLAKPGTVTVSLTSLTPDSTLTITMAIGVYNQYYLTCTDLITNDNTKVGTSLQGLATATTALCVRLTDTSGVVPSAGDTYIITVTRVPSI